MSSLARYRSKRDFDITPEPPAATRRSGKTLRYFIQRHHARALHYDFRLEVDGVLKSWAIPKGPSLDPHDKRLAVRVEDHPYDYGNFEGTIPARQYGAGEVVLWDRGEWVPLSDPVAGLKKGRVEFELRGVKLSGRWILVRMGKADPEKENWLLIKESDQQARTGKQADITALRPESVKTHRRHAGAATAGETSETVEAVPGDKKRTVRHSAMPAMVDAQLATLVAEAPDGEDWLSEIKFDGYRGLCRIEAGKAQIFTREHHDWSSRWPELIKALAALQLNDAWLDGEVVALLEDGSISFDALQDQSGKQSAHLVLYVFDLLWLNGRDLRDEALVERKRLLRELVPGVDDSGFLRYSEHVVGDAAAVFRHACLHGMEGTVVKRINAPYSGRRDRSWLKLKSAQRQEFVIAGYTDPAGSRSGFGALLMGVYDRQHAHLHYAGRVGSGFDEHQLTSLRKKFKSLVRKQPAFVDPPRGRSAQGVHWLAPQLVAEVKFAQWTKSGILRHGTFVALREDKRAADIVREIAQQGSATAAIDMASPGTASTSKKPGAKSDKKEKQDADLIQGVRLTHPGKILLTPPDLTKLDLAHYYVSMADWILPHIQRRPMTMVRCPDGGMGKCFFQRHIGQGVPGAIDKITVPEGEGSADYMMINSVAALVATVQMDVLELHTWGSLEKKLLQPDRIVFDLDPAPDVAWSKVVDGAKLLHGLLQEIGLASFLKTSGGKGLHIVVPIVAEHDWDVVKQWARCVALHLAEILPDYFTANMAKAARTGKIFIDYLRNAQGATTVAAYSPRAKSGAPISTPLSWAELTPKVHADSYTIFNIGQRLGSLKRDPWQDYAHTRQRLARKMLKLFSTTG